jgi:hypothetical protein
VVTTAGAAAQAALPALFAKVEVDLLLEVQAHQLVMVAAKEVLEQAHTAVAAAKRAAAWVKAEAMALGAAAVELAQEDGLFAVPTVVVAAAADMRIFVIKLTNM